MSQPLRDDGDRLDLDLRSWNRQPAYLDERARRAGLAEELAADGVDPRTVVDVSQVHGHLRGRGEGHAGRVLEAAGVTFATSAKVTPAASSTRPTFSSACRVWATTSPPPTSLPSESTGTQPETNSRSPARTASV